MATKTKPLATSCEGSLPLESLLHIPDPVSLSLVSIYNKKKEPRLRHLCYFRQLTGSTCSVMHRDMVEWRGQNPPPGTIMIISDQVNGDFSWDLARLQQRTRYGLFLAYSKKQCNDYLLVYFANCRWEKLLEEGGAPPVVVAGELSSAAMFYCKSCNFDCQSLKKFRKHLSSYKHGMEVSKHSLSLSISNTFLFNALSNNSFVKRRTL